MRSKAVRALSIAAFVCLPGLALAQQAAPKRIDPDSISQQTGVHAILFEAANGFQLLYPDRRLASNIRLDVGDPAFLSRYLSASPLAPGIDAAGAMQIARALVQQAIQHRHKGDLQAAYFLYRFALANLAQSDDLQGLDIVTHNVWALRGAARVRDEGQPGASKYVLDLIAGDAVVLQGLLASDPRFLPQMIARDPSLRPMRIGRRMADLAGRPTGFAEHAARVLASGDARSIPIGWITPAAEELANRDLLSVLAADGRIKGDAAGFQQAWQLYEALRPRIQEIANVGELSFVLDLAKHNYQRMRSQAVAGGGTFGHSISLFTVSKYLQAFGRDLATLTWRRGSREQALVLAEDMQSRAVTDWLARSHRSNRLMLTPGISGSAGEIRPAGLAEIRDLAKRRQSPVLVYFKASDAYILWVVLPDGKIETTELKFGRGDLDGILTVFPYGSESSPVASSARAARSATRTGTGNDTVAAQAAAAELELKRKWLADLRRKVLPDAILQLLQGHARLLIVADGLVNYVPFAALIDQQGKYLIDTFSVQHAPSVTTALVLEQSAQVRKTMRTQAAADTVIAVPSQDDVRQVEISVGGKRQSFTFDPLAGAAEETARITGILRGRVSPAIPTGSRTYLPVLHFATHGFFNVEEPLASFLILQQGKLTAEQLYFGQMHIETGLVVMSACQTGLGFAHPDSLIGLRNGFLVAGAQSVVGTLWIISDDATLDLMDTFYRAVAGGGLLDDALRQAQLALKTKPEYADPVYWAAFQLTGHEQNPL